MTRSLTRPFLIVLGLVAIASTLTSCASSARPTSKTSATLLKTRGLVLPVGARTSARYFNRATAHPDTVKYWDSRLEAAFLKGIRKYDLGDRLWIDSSNRFERGQRSAMFVSGRDTIHAPLPVAFADSSKLYLLTEDLRGFQYGGGILGHSDSKHFTDLLWLVYDPSSDSVLLGGKCKNETNARNEFWNPNGDRTDWIRGATKAGWDLAEALDRWL